MSDRGLLFLFSVLMVVGGLAATVWLVITGQALTVDGLFLVLTALLIALCFAMYLVFMIRRAMEAAQAPPAPAAKTAPAAAAKPAPAPAPTAQT
jgi:Na+-transporting methylmalonyl-CoA/oxaloacetate decarboxylase gamma subunit